MSKIYKKIEYPCGLIFEVSYSSFCNIPDNDFEYRIDDCPLHGKNCKKKLNKGSDEDEHVDN